MCEHHCCTEDKHKQNVNSKNIKKGRFSCLLQNNSVVRAIIAAVILIFAIMLDLSPSTEFAVFLIAYLIAGGDILYRAFRNILKKNFLDENFLMSVATLGAFAIKEYPEAVAVMVLYQIGEFFQHRAVEKSRNSIAELMDIRPDFANIEENGKILKKSPDEIKIGDIITVKTGEKIPLDGIVIEGEAIIDASALTGESLPKTLKENDEVISGCINTNGVIKIRVTKEFGESTVSKILELTENASSKKAKAENFITKFARYYTPVVVAGAVLLAFIPPLLTGAQFDIWLERALTFLVISCPCALVISVPLGFFAGIGGASKCGILIKGSNYIETLSKADTVVFDKTGTLTKGVFKVIKVIPQKGFTKEELLFTAASAEKYSNHPVALSLKDAYKNNLDKNLVQNVQEFAGSGISAVVNNDRILAGNNKLMEKFKIDYEKTSENGTIVYIAKNNKYTGCIVISDEIKEDAVFAFKKLKEIVNHVEILTGDSYETAKHIKDKLNADKVYAELLPNDKVQRIEELIENKQKNKSVIFVGDGINDAPVLTRADAGIAMGALGSDAAIEAADVVIMDDKPSKVIKAIQIAKKTMRIVKQNIVFAISVKILFLILGAFGYITMWGAVFADVGVTLIAVLNSLRTLQIKCFVKE